MPLPAHLRHLDALLDLIVDAAVERACAAPERDPAAEPGGSTHSGNARNDDAPAAPKPRRGALTESRRAHA